MLLSRKAIEVEQEILKLKNYALKTEEEKVHLERKSREAESLTVRLVEESQKRASEAERLKNELINARVAEKEAKEKLLTFLSLSSISPVPVQMLSPDRYMSTSVSSQSLNESTTGTYQHVGNDEKSVLSYELAENHDINDISLEIERERTEMLSKSKQIQSQLKGLRSEIEMLKISESEFDRINAEQLKTGDNKYSTLKKALKQKFFFL
jgi:merlin